MAFGRYGTFTGGIDLPEEKGATLDSPIEPWVPAGPLRVPLNPCGGGPGEVLVEVGQVVEAGQRLAAAGPGGVDVFAPARGTVGGLAQAAVLTGGGWSVGPAVELTDLSLPAEPSGPPAFLDYWSPSAEDLRRRLAAGGLMTAVGRSVATGS